MMLKKRFITRKSPASVANPVFYGASAGAFSSGIAFASAPDLHHKIRVEVLVCEFQNGLVVIVGIKSIVDGKPWSKIKILFKHLS